MIELTEVIFRAGMPIDGYGPGFFRLGQHAHQGPLLVLPSGLVSWSGLEDLQAIVAARVEYDILLIGMGAEISPLPPSAREALEAADVPLDVMATPPGLRTYNVLLAEERRVALAALPV